MRSKPEIFEKHAARCERLAAEVSRCDLSAMYLDLAAQWRELTDQLRSLQEGDPERRGAGWSETRTTQPG